MYMNKFHKNILIILVAISGFIILRELGVITLNWTNFRTNTVSTAYPVYPYNSETNPSQTNELLGKQFVVTDPSTGNIHTFIVENSFIKTPYTPIFRKVHYKILVRDMLEPLPVHPFTPDMTPTDINGISVTGDYTITGFISEKNLRKKIYTDIEKIIQDSAINTLKNKTPL